MNLNEEFLENTIKSLESSFGEINLLKNNLLGASLDQFKYIFELNTEKTPIFKELGKKEVLEMKTTLELEMLPLFKDSEYQEGIDQVNEWVKLLEGELE